MPADCDPRQEFVNKLTFAMNEAGQLGLYRTMHKLHEAVREVGWEIAGQMEVIHRAD